ncbi:amidase signature domain-containing protein [Dipodascopsis tothii]|uniref:amidase signature domain-containing protein n=1 Tax=Dipodascopsis tothii TaxID=44089 RepID=UPI0034CFFA48
MSTIEGKTWQEIVAEKRATQKALLAPYMLPEDALPAADVLDVVDFIDSCGALTATESEITGISDIAELAAAVAAGTYSASAVILAYVKRATIAHQLTNCLTEVVFEAALERAAALDKAFAETGKPVGPLHGVPVTFKDQFNVLGVDTTLGFVGRSFDPVVDKAKEAVLITILERMGAVVLAKSNLPQSIMWPETDNPLWGRTCNPQRRDFTPGGSTGGEGALLKLNASIVGWGTDLGGSVRIPMAMAGGYALRPGAGRLPYEGVPVTLDGQEHVPSVIGPMTRTLPSLVAITKAVIDGEPWTLDPKALPMPWRPAEYTAVKGRKLRIGLMPFDGVVRVHPPVERALREAAAKLAAAGHEIVPWEANQLHQELVPILNSFYSADGGEDVRSAVMKCGEPFVPYVKAMVNRAPPSTIPQYWKAMVAKRELQKKYLDRWNASGALTASGEPIDFILCPSMPHTSIPFEHFSWVGYTRVWNGLDYTAVVFPAGTADRELDAPTAEQKAYEPVNDWDKTNWAIYDIEKMHGLPISLQLVGRKLEEEKVLAGTEVVVEALGL